MQDWANLGRSILRDRRRRGWKQKELAAAAGLTVRTVGGYERGEPPKSAPSIPAGLFAVGLALEWPSDGVERALAGDEPHPTAPIPDAPPTPVAPGQQDAVALYPLVVAFGRAAVQQGGSATLRDAMEVAAEKLLESIPAESRRPRFGLAAYRPHAWSEGDPAVPADDQARIRDAVRTHRDARESESRRGTDGE